VYTLYAGPKQYSELSRFRNYQVDVMEFGRLGAIGKILLRAMVFFHGLLPNYGIAVILLTCLIRLVFWPLTHKSGQSMRKMQELQPEIAKIKATIKDPKKQQVATMALYKEHKVNPVGGCLPMLIQIPVFIALFVVLRSAIELRFAPFLWIRDLSEPENLFPGLIPYVSGLNLLPLIMTALQVWQQKLTPAGGDPAQQKMMTWMPVIMLVFFYNFASGLVLYWTVNQALMIVQLLMQKRRVAHRAA
jgi:YidC/Oxa1 family membrane protein insertase